MDPQGVRMTLTLWDGGCCPSSSCSGSCVHPSGPPSSSACLAPGRLKQVSICTWGCPQSSQGTLCIPKGCPRCHHAAQSPQPEQPEHVFTLTQLNEELCLSHPTAGKIGGRGCWRHHSCRCAPIPKPRGTQLSWLGLLRGRADPPRAAGWGGESQLGDPVCPDVIFTPTLHSARVPGWGCGFSAPRIQSWGKRGWGSAQGARLKQCGRRGERLHPRVPSPPPPSCLWAGSCIGTILLPGCWQSPSSQSCLKIVTDNKPVRFLGQFGLIPLAAASGSPG